MIQSNIYMEGCHIKLDLINGYTRTYEVLKPLSIFYIKELENAIDPRKEDKEGFISYKVVKHLIVNEYIKEI